MVNRTEERINIMDLVIEEPRVETGPLPPPLNLITKADWPEIYEELRDLKNNGSPDFIYRAYELDVMFPGSLDGFKSGLLLAAEQYKNDFVISGREDTQFVHTLELVKRIFPKKLLSMLTPVNVLDLKDTINERLQRGSAGPVWFQEAAAYKGLFPSDDLDLEKTKQLLGNYIKRQPTNLLDWEARCKGSLRILLGDSFDELKPDKIFLKRHLEYLQEQKYKQPDLVNIVEGDYVNWSGIIEHLFYLSVCAAKEIKFTDRGLELVMEEEKHPLEQTIPALPEVKKYGN